jgi:hypothetical protein
MSERVWRWSDLFKLYLIVSLVAAAVIGISKLADLIERGLKCTCG